MGLLVVRFACEEARQSTIRFDLEDRGGARASWIFLAAHGTQRPKNPWAVSWVSNSFFCGQFSKGKTPMPGRPPQNSWQRTRKQPLGGHSTYFFSRHWGSWWAVSWVSHFFEGSLGKAGIKGKPETMRNTQAYGGSQTR